jgi:predicted phage terminase large subunit-like protein
MLLETNLSQGAESGYSPNPAKPLPLTEDQVEFLRHSSRENFYFFAKFVLEFPFEESWLQPHIHRPICETLQDPKNTNVRVVLPRSWLKSTLCSVYYPIWRAIRDPNIRILIVQNSAPNAEKKLSAIRGQFESNPLLRLLFSSLLPDSSSQWTTKNACLKRSVHHPEATFETAGTRSRVVSRHYDIIIEDDTVCPDLDELQESNVVPTKDDIEQAIGFHRHTTGLLNDPMRSQSIIVGTRWFERDLISWNAENEPSYVCIERAVRETDGHADPRGEITYPERFGQAALEMLERRWGPYLFSCLYLNNPLRSADMVFRKEWFKEYADAPRNLVTYTTVDPAGGGISGRSRKAKADLDFNVVMTVGKDLYSGFVYVLDYDRFKGSPGDLINKIFEHQKLWGSLAVGIEAQQYQNSLDYFVKEQMPKRQQFFMIEMLKSIKAKESRIRALQPLFAAGLIWTRSHHIDLRSELEAFPLGAHDDCADALSMVLQLLEITQPVGTTQDSEPSDPMSLDFAIASFQGATKKDGLLEEMLFSPEFETVSMTSPNSLTNQFIDSAGGFMEYENV